VTSPGDEQPRCRVLRCGNPPNFTESVYLEDAEVAPGLGGVAFKCCFDKIRFYPMLRERQFEMVERT
jgi:hypothetical protein